MFCRNCGKSVAQQAVVCVNCGIAPLNASRYCQYCGAQTNPVAEICVKCGVRLQRRGWNPAAEGKDWLTALLLAIFLGYLGIHRFYTGHIELGILQLLTLGGCGIWSLIDIILIATGSFKDRNGNPLVKH